MSVELPITGEARGFKDYCNDCPVCDLDNETFISAGGQPLKAVIWCKHSWACSRMYEMLGKSNDESWKYAVEKS